MTGVNMTIPEDWSQLQEEYKDLLGENFYFECNTGWYNILRCFLRLVLHEKEHSPEKFEEFHVYQIKEKFGTLRVYLSSTTEKVVAAVQYAELLSSCTCETCGRPGERRGGGWISTLCDRCANPEG